MICPFRLNRINVYGDVENVDGSKINVLDSIKEEYPKCYEQDCPHWHYDVSRMDNGHQGWYCTQAELIDSELNEEEKGPWVEC